MKRLLPLLAILLLANVAYGQNTRSASADVTVKVNVVPKIEIELSESTLDFGDVVIGEVPSLAANETEAIAATISGAAGQLMNVTFEEAVLNGPEDSELTFQPDVTSNTSGVVEDGTNVLLSGDVEEGGEGSATLYIGGSVDTEQAALGEHSGIFTLNVSYASL